MYEIAQYYGLKLSDLLERNLLKEGQEPKVGEVVLLNDKAATAPKTRSNYEIERDIQFEESTPNQKIIEEKKQEQKINTDKVNNSLKLDVPVYSNETYNPAKQVNSSTENDEKFENINFPAEDKSDFSLEPESEINNNESKVNTAPALSEKEYVIHNVENGETLFSIGRKYGVSWDKIRDYNQLDKITLETNQEIKIPRL
jgi:LysM repeat protein